MQKPHEIRELLLAAEQIDRYGVVQGQGRLFSNVPKLHKAILCFKRFRQTSRLAFLIYVAFLMVLAGSYFTAPGWLSSSALFLSFGGFLGLLFFSFFSKSGFYHALGKSDGGENPLILLFLGMPMYILVYFHLEKLMKDELRNAVEELKSFHAHP
jgi:hypothetical protein